VLLNNGGGKLKIIILIGFFLFFPFGLLNNEITVCAGKKLEWKEQKSRHFSIFYRNAPKEFVDTVEKSAEEYYKVVTKNLGFYRMQNWTFDRRAEIYVFDDADDYVKRSGQYAWSAGTASTRRKLIRTYPSAHGFFDSTLPHELGHIIFREFVGYRTLIPLWFEEGVAMHQEKAKRFGADKKVKETIEKGTFIPLDKLTTMRLSNKTNRQTVELFYSEAASVFNFLIKRIGNYRFVSLCRSFKNGVNFEQALKKTYPPFRSIERLNELWIKSLGK